ncbi:MAG TPA: iron-sulfur cluster assembly scaffold protein [Caulobacteraceae bacterium]|jgi:NifU-like protein involved in Fe-S cluster formation
MFDDLYTERVLRLAADIPRAGRLADPHGTASKTAKLCGSTVVLDVKLAEGRVTDFAQEVQACALGQAAAGVLGANIVGATVDEVLAAREALHAMLKRGGPPPEGRFADLRVLEPVKEFPARHASTTLAFDAAADAIGAAQSSREATGATVA